MNTTEKIKSVIDDYDDIANEYAKEFDSSINDNKYINKFLLSLNGKEVLDAGCGTGKDCKYMKDLGYDITGIDLSNNMLVLAKEKCPDIRLDKMDISNITYEVNSFDGIISLYSLFHIPRELLPKTIEGFKRILRPNGKLLLIVNEGTTEEMIDEPYRDNVKLYMNYFTKDNITNLLITHDFIVDTLDYEYDKLDNGLSSGGQKLIVYATNKKDVDKDDK